MFLTEKTSQLRTLASSPDEPEEERHQDPGAGLGHPQPQARDAPPQQQAQVAVVPAPALRTGHEPGLMLEQARQGGMPCSGGSGWAWAGGAADRWGRRRWGGSGL